MTRISSDPYQLNVTRVWSVKLLQLECISNLLHYVFLNILCTFNQN